MFSQKKSFIKGKIFYLVLIGLFIFGLWVNQVPDDLDLQDGISADAQQSVDGVDNPSQENYDIMENIIKGKNDTTTTGVEDELPVENPVQQEEIASSYYLLKEVDGTIKIFHYDEEGKETFIRNTDIAFSLLSLTDQAMFQKGIIKNSTDELFELLQDFES
ncbi:MAG: hypothetical protein ACOX5F_04860 [Anaerovoracaceae bacterium]